MGGEIRFGEVDGVRAMWSDLPGPLHAHLLFGVGQAHETLPQHGLTHLLEHLVLTGSNEAPHAYNGMTGTVSTHFVVSGTEADVVSHLGSVCAQLQDVQVDRLEHERGVLRTEASQRSGSPSDPLLMWRWGPQGFGIPAYEELALRWVAADDVRAWSGRFGSDNAVLWLSQPPPAGLRLPLSARRDTSLCAPALVSADSPLPAAFPLPERGVTLGLLCEREPAATSAMALLQQRLEQRLRHEQGLVYSVLAGTDVLDGATRHNMFRIDCLPENSRRVQDEVVALLLAVTQEASDDEWSRLVAQHDLFLQVPEEHRLAQYLDMGAQSLLLGRAVQPMAAWDAAVRAVTREQVSDYLQRVPGTLTIGVVEPDAVPWSVARPLPVFSTERVGETQLDPSGRNPDPGVQTAFVGRQGASLVRATGETVSVRTDKLAAALCFDDGARHLIGTDGFAVKLAPEEWVRPQAALRALEASLPADRRVPMGSREPSPRVHPRLVPRDMWLTLRHGPARARAWLVVLFLAFCLGVVGVAVGRPAPLALFLASLAWTMRRERRRVPPLPAPPPRP